MHQADGCVTKQYVGLGASFTPTWFQVLPNVDLLAPVAVSSGVHGNSAAVLGGNRYAGNYSVGIAADVQQAYRIDLRYVDYFGQTKDNAAGRCRRPERPAEGSRLRRANDQDDVLSPDRRAEESR